jgi:hypothetical protein
MFDTLVNDLVDLGAVVAVAVIVFVAILYLVDRHSEKRPRVQPRQPAGACWRVLPPLDRGAAPYDWDEE